MSPGLRYFARVEGAAPAQVGAYLPDYNGDLTVYWRGHVGRENVRSFIDEAEAALSRSGRIFSGKLDAYGISSPDPADAERHIQTSPAQLAITLDPEAGIPTFDACRAELTVAQGKVIIWANVSGEETAPLEEGGENIGVSVPQSLFKEDIRAVIKHAISMTMNLKPKYAERLLNEISIAIEKRTLSPG